MRLFVIFNFKTSLDMDFEKKIASFLKWIVRYCNVQWSEKKKIA